MKIGMYGGKFLPLHQGHVSCILEASSRCDVLYVALSHSFIRDKMICDIDSFPYISSEKRCQWLDQIASTLPNVKVIDFEDFDGLEYDSWEAGAKQVNNKIFADCGEYPTLIFGSEYEYEHMFNKLYSSSTYVLLDSDRSKFNISSTEIRRDGVFKHWEFIPKVCRPFYNKKVVILGTESCGKSTMVKKLAAYYNTEFVEEYGRLMCERLNTGQPTAEYYPYIAYGHKMLEFEQNLKANKVLLVDTESTITQFYSKLYCGIDYEVLQTMSTTHKYDLYIYLEPDVEWVDDGLRIHGACQERTKNNSILKDMLHSVNIDFISVRGSYAYRFYRCVELIDGLLQ